MIDGLRRTHDAVGVDFDLDPPTGQSSPHSGRWVIQIRCDQLLSNIGWQHTVGAVGVVEHPVAAAQSRTQADIVITSFMKALASFTDQLGQDGERCTTIVQLLEFLHRESSDLPTSQ